MPVRRRSSSSSGKVYPVERIDAALNNFFKIENLSALREVALRQVAEEVGQRRFAATSNVGSREESIASEAPRAVAERLMALVEPYPGAHRLVRRAWRSAQRLGADLDLLWVRPPGSLNAEQENSLTALRQLASLLGARLIVEESDDPAREIAFDGSITREIRCGNQAALGGVRRPGGIDSDDDGVAKYLFAHALRIDDEKRKKTTFEIAKVTFQSRIEITDPGLEARGHGISDDCPHGFIRLRHLSNA